MPEFVSGVFLALLVTTCLPFSPCLADENKMYLTEDPSGVPFFSNKKSHQNAGEIALPKIAREKAKTFVVPVTCKQHRGVDCRAGQDADGSVICLDGFKDSSQRFLFNCMSTKLEMTEISELRPNGSFSVFLRNVSGVTAENVKIAFHAEPQLKFELEGPPAVEPFGLAEFIFTPGRDRAQPIKPKSSQIKLSCDNCP